MGVLRLLTWRLIHAKPVGVLYCSRFLPTLARRASKGGKGFLRLRFGLVWTVTLSPVGVFVAVAGLLALLPAAGAFAADPVPLHAEKETSNAYMRLTRDERKSPLALETAIVRFTPRDGSDSPTVDLIGAVHIAEKGYYEQLNREFAGYDAVLYELVAPEEAKVPDPNASPTRHPIALLQTGMKDLLDLQYQLQGIDYTRKNMVHADMSPSQFADSMQERGDSLVASMLRMAGYSLARQNPAGQGAADQQLLLALFDKNRSVALKRAFAEQVEQSEGAVAALDGPKGSTLVTERNKVALEVLRKELAAGKKRLAIFYGAAHMRDFQKRLQDDFALSPRETRWLVAWKLAAEPKDQRP